MDTTIAIAKEKNISLTIALFSLSFCIPLLFNGSQIITGIIINTLLFIAASQVSKRTLLLIAVIPSLGAISHGVLFGGLTMYLVYFLPFIWMGNMMLMYIVGIKKQATFAFILAALAKSSFLFLIAYVFVSLHIVPKIFLTAMGFLQLVTALVGGVAAIGISKYLLKPIYE